MLFLDRISDAVNPIVVKELRQAVQSRFVVAVLLVFLLAQLLFMAIYLMVQSLDGSLYASDFQAGRRVFSFLHAILLAACMLCIPAYCGFRLAAERSEVHVDLFYISALRPRAIVAGKFVAALVLAILIFSACTPFMTFTYFLRGIDIGSIFFMIGLDFLVVSVAAMLALFLAVVPANRVFKVLLGLGGLFVGLIFFFYAIGSMVAVLEDNLAVYMEDLEFWVGCLFWVLQALGVVLFLFTCSVGLLSPPSANRTLPLRLGLTLFCLLGAVPLFFSAYWFEEEWPVIGWLISIGILLAFGILVAVNEREQWAPRVARTIPRRWWLRPGAFVFYSGAAGGILWVCVLGAFCLIVLPVAAGRSPEPLLGQRALESMQTVSAMMAMMLGYLYCYALTAVFLRNTLIKLPPLYTWVLALGLLLMGSGLPYVVTFLVYQRDWEFWALHLWLLTDPAAGMTAIGWDPGAAGAVTTLFIGCWATLVTLLNTPWFFRQVRRFRPYASSVTPGGEMLRPILAATPMDATKTAP